MRRSLLTAAICLLQSLALYGQSGWQWQIGDLGLLPGNPPALQAEIRLLNAGGADTLHLGHHTVAGRFSADLFDFGENHDPEIASCSLDSFTVSLTDGPEPYDLQWNAVCDGVSGMAVPAEGDHIFSVRLYIRNIQGVSDILFQPLEQTFTRSGLPIDIAYDDSQGSVSLDTTNMAVEGAVKPPHSYALFPNHPNPFNPGTTVTYEIPRAGYTELTVLDIRGRKIRTLYTGTRQPGSYTLYWDGMTDNGEPAAAGVLLLRLRSGRHHSFRKMLLLK